MHINFQFHGCLYKADIRKKDNRQLVAELIDTTLERQFGRSLAFYIEDKSVAFDTLNPCHSDLYALNSTISRAISEQCTDILE